ncbi:hypothetical protein Q6348_12795 [Isoptericola sp. b441]|uniref:Uncharacterized protein n=1 Tax=Actinotalea lenta TaxID=3064654 RepID=A0ABT9DEU2_9CELL|nr:hypothetical protein [Isoptericola sp. b441]MDO8108073.1 hypothetical protein [Isoptericola sp. b441]
MARMPLHVPDEVRTALDLDEPALTFAPFEGGWAVATRSGLHLLRDGTALHRRWTDVDGASLDGDSGELEIRWVDGTPPARFVVDAGSRLPRVVHDRVQNSVVLAETVSVPGDRKLRVALRRSADGALFSQVIGNGRVDLSDPAVAQVVDAAEARVREAAGL